MGIATLASMALCLVLHDDKKKCCYPQFSFTDLSLFLSEQQSFTILSASCSSACFVLVVFHKTMPITALARTTEFHFGLLTISITQPRCLWSASTYCPRFWLLFSLEFLLASNRCSISNKYNHRYFRANSRLTRLSLKLVCTSCNNNFSLCGTILLNLSVNIIHIFVISHFSFTAVGR